MALVRVKLDQPFLRKRKVPYHSYHTYHCFSLQNDKQTSTMVRVVRVGTYGAPFNASRLGLKVRKLTSTPRVFRTVEGVLTLHMYHTALARTNATMLSEMDPRRALGVVSRVATRF